MLQIKNLTAKIEDDTIINNLSLSINPGEMHIIMGPNGSGKSTLTKILMGHPAYTITEGSILYKNKDLLELESYERALEGIFLSFQQPIEIPGINNLEFLEETFKSLCEYQNLPLMKTEDFKEFVLRKAKDLHLNPTFLERNVNEGFSGGEKKKNEILQLSLFKPSLAILDETDSGLDIDALKIVAQGIEKERTKNNSFLIITHYQRLLDFLTPNFVHILKNGTIVKSGTKELALELEKKGYAE